MFITITRCYIFRSYISKMIPLCKEVVPVSHLHIVNRTGAQFACRLVFPPSKKKKLSNKFENKIVYSLKIMHSRKK